MKHFKDIVTQHIAVVGKTGSGKTSTAKLLVEHVVAQGSRVCILDPIKSDWWGLTSSADGKKPGLPFQILGGPHGHVQIQESAGKVIAELVASGALPLSIIDMADFKAGGLQTFFNDFAPTLLKKMRGVLYLVIEEAHEFAPKERAGFGGENMAIHFAKKLATAGRSKGIRLIVATQRTQSLHNAVLGSCETLITHRLTAPADQEPIKAWLKGNVGKDLVEEVSRSFAALKNGEGWMISGEAGIAERMQFPRIKTYDNSATPTDDDHRHQVKTAAVDPEKLKALIGSAATAAAQDDPVALRRRIVELEKQLAAKGGVSEEKLEIVKTKAYHEGWMAGHADGATLAAKEIASNLRQVAIDMEAMRFPSKELPSADVAQPVEHRPSKPNVASSKPVVRSMPPSPSNLQPAKQRIIDALRWLEAMEIRTAHKLQLALLSEQSPSSSGYANNLGGLRSAGLIEYPSGGMVALTEAGRAQAREPEGVASSADLHKALQRQLPAAKWRILEALIGAYPDAMTKGDLAAASGQSVTSSGYANNLGSLRSLGFIDYPSPGMAQAQHMLFIRGRR